MLRVICQAEVVFKAEVFLDAISIPYNRVEQMWR